MVIVAIAAEKGFLVCYLHWQSRRKCFNLDLLVIHSNKLNHFVVCSFTVNDRSPPKWKGCNSESQDAQ